MLAGVPNGPNVPGAGRISLASHTGLTRARKPDLAHGHGFDTVLFAVTNKR